MENNQDRRLELSLKFLEMGQALSKEGFESKDHSIIQSGNVFIMLGGYILNEVDMFEFIDYITKFSASKILDGIEKSGGDLSKYIQANSQFSIDDYINDIKKEIKRKSDQDNDKSSEEDTDKK